MTATLGFGPEARKDKIEDGINDDGVRYDKEAHGARAEDQRRQGDEGIRRIEVAAEEEPGDSGAEATSAQPPFVQTIEIGLPPMRRDESKPGHEQEERDEDGRGGQINTQSTSPGESTSKSDLDSRLAPVTRVSIK